MVDAQGDHADTIGLTGVWRDSFELRGGLEVSLEAQWYSIREGHETPRSRAPIHQVTVYRKDGKVVFSVTQVPRPNSR